MARHILDATAGGRHIWHSEMQDADNVVFADRRRVQPGEIEQQEAWSVSPDVLADARQLPFPDDTFDLICFDPPHRIKDGGMTQLSGIIEKKYGALEAETWQADLKDSFNELWRVLRPGGSLTFKWADVHKTSEEVLAQIDQTPLYGTVDQGRSDRSGTKWWVFHKPQVRAREPHPEPAVADGGFALDAEGGKP